MWLLYCIRAVQIFNFVFLAICYTLYVYIYIETSQTAVILLNGGEHSRSILNACRIATRASDQLTKYTSLRAK